MPGTNDLKEIFNASPRTIAAGAEMVARAIWDGRYASPADGTFATLIYANWFGKILSIINPYFNQHIYKTYVKAAQLMNHDWDNLPFATQLSTAYRDSLVPSLAPGGNSVDVIEQWDPCCRNMRAPRGSLWHRACTVELRAAPISMGAALNAIDRLSESAR